MLVFTSILMMGAGAALVSAWIDRNTLGAKLAVGYLARYRIHSVFRLTRLDIGGVEGSLVLGQADHPTLVAPHFVAEFAAAPFFGMPRLRRVALDHPRLELVYDGRRLDFGALQPLINAAGRVPKGKGPTPAIVVSDGELRLHTPYGRLSAGISAEITEGVLRTAEIQLRPSGLTLPDSVTTAGLTGRILIREQGAGRYGVQGRLVVENVTLRRTTLHGSQVVFDVELPFRQEASEPFAGPIRGSLQGSSKAISGPGAIAKRGRVTASVAGDLSGARSLPTFRGHVGAKAQVDQLSLGATQLSGMNLDAQGVDLNLGPSRQFGAQFSVRGDARTGRAKSHAGALWLSSMRIAVAGRVRSDANGATLAAMISFVTSAGLERAKATALATQLAPGPFGADLRPALEHALAHTVISAPGLRLTSARHTWTFHLDQPLQAQSAGGARLTVAGLGGRWASTGPSVTGDGTLTLSGGGFPDAKVVVEDASLGPRHLNARISADVFGSAGPIRSARLGMAGWLVTDGAAERFTLARCAKVAFDALQSPGLRPLATAANVDICPAGAGPLLVWRGDTWQATARIQGLAVEAPSAEIAVNHGDADLRFAGRGSTMAGKASIAHVDLHDTAASPRFRPLQVSGLVALTGQKLTGAIDLELSQPMYPLAKIQVYEDFRSGAGAVELKAPQLVFAPNGLQPAAVLPGLVSLGKDVSGPASANLNLRWRGSELTSLARVRLEGVQLKTAAGLLSGVRTDLVLTGLDPLTSRPDQRLTADQIAAVLPLTDLSATYAISGNALELTDTQASLAGGRIALDPMRLALTPGATLTGVVRADAVELGTVLDVLNLSRSVTIQAKISGSLPFTFGPQGLRITDGRLAAIGPGRLTVRRDALTGVALGNGSGAPPTSAVQDFAYQALEDLAFTELDARVGSRPQGRLGVIFHIRGRHDPPVAGEARVSMMDLLRGHAFDRPIPLPKGTDVNLTLDTSLNLDDLLSAYLGRSAPVQP